jgi:hypothetical protein
MKLNRIYEGDNNVTVDELLETELGKAVTPGHYYLVKTGNTAQLISFQEDGPAKAIGIHGVTTEAILAMLLHRTSAINTKAPSDELELATVHLDRALQVIEGHTLKLQAHAAV